MFHNSPLKQTSTSKNNVQLACIQVIHSLFLMISILMSEDRTERDEVDAYVKLFMSCVNRLCLYYWSGDPVPFWTKTRNFPTLLVLGKQIERHGDIRWYWEGTSKRYIRQSKKELLSMRRTAEYVGRKIMNLYKNTFLHWMKKYCIHQRMRKKSRDGHACITNTTLSKRSSIAFGQVE